jgi:ATP-binding cassette subfamily F protein 3
VLATLQIQDISLAFGDRDILDGVSFTLDHTSRSALVGANGSGKSTLMKILAHQMSADTFTATTSRDLRVSYLPQGDIVFGGATLYHETERAWDRFLPLIAEQHRLEDDLQSEASEAKILRLGEIHEQLVEERYHDRRQITEGVLFGLGFVRDDLDRICNTFSGGWQMRIALAKILIEQPQIMLLDEPTNYLDIEARFWLKNYLKVYEGGLMLVSHDQRFLDETVGEVYELFEGKLTRYSGNYSAYLSQRQAQIAALEAEARSQALLFEKNEQFIERFRYKASKSRQVQSRIKMLDKIEQVKIPAHLRELSFSFAPAPPSGRDVVVIEHLDKRYGALSVYEDFSLWVNRGERLAITGRNGVGKSTLLRLIAGEDSDYSGTIRLGSKVSIGYFSQETGSTLNEGNSVLDEASEAASTSDQARVRSLLGSFLFEGDDVFKGVGVLSGGEKSRLALLKILLKPVNLLILDEPTNHLDINAKQMLLKALSAWNGTIIFVSHDADFIESLASKILYLNEGEKPLLYEGGYSDFVARLEEKEALSPTLLRASVAAPAERTRSYKEAKERKNRIAILRREEESRLALHQRLGQKTEAVEAEMALPENYSDGERIVALITEKERLDAEMSEVEQEWLQLVDEREALEAEARDA